MAALEVRATTLDQRFTTLDQAVLTATRAIADSRDVMQQAAVAERGERTLWLGQFGRLLTTQSSGITQAINLLSDRVSEQGARIDGLGGKLQLVMEANDALREHQENGLADAISKAVSSAVICKATGEAQAHVMELGAAAQMAIAVAEAEAKRDPWLLRLLQTKAGPVPIGGILALATLVLTLAALESGTVSAALEWMLHLVGGGH